jgi:cardiolipin synthase
MKAPFFFFSSVLLLLAGCGGGGAAAVTPPPAGTPGLTASVTSIAFPNAIVNQPSPSQSITLTNSGNATLNISGIALAGSGAAAFSQSSTCGATLAANATCTVSVVFTPPAASTYSAAVNVSDNAPGSPQSIVLSGTVPPAGGEHTLYVFPEPDLSVTPLYALINGAQSTIDMTMYALEDTTFSADLVAACHRGVTVRVILDQNLERNGNTPAYNQLNGVANCSAVWADSAFQATHQKTFVIDGTQAAIMSLNLQSQYYSTTRDFALVENDVADIAAIKATFNADYAAGTPSSGTPGASDFSYVPGGGGDLIWSPTTAQADMLTIINNATTTLLVENEEMGAANIVSALEAACQRGVTVHIAMVNDDGEYGSEFSALEAAGCGVHVYPDTATGFYVHAKAVVADYGLPTQSIYMGSINYSNASMTENRELGLYITDAGSALALYNSMTNDYAGGTAY